MVRRVALADAITDIETTDPLAQCLCNLLKSWARERMSVTTGIIILIRCHRENIHWS